MIISSFNKNPAHKKIYKWVIQSVHKVTNHFVENGFFNQCLHDIINIRYVLQD